MNNNIVIEFKNRTWTCGDGCCTDYITDIVLNGKVAIGYSFFDDTEIMQLIINKINQLDLTNKIIFEVKPFLTGEVPTRQPVISKNKSKRKEYPHIPTEDLVFMNGEQIGKIDNYSILSHIAQMLNLDIEFISYDYDYEKTLEEEELVLIDNPLVTEFFYKDKPKWNGRFE